jgi:hypothetical protein
MCLTIEGFRTRQQARNFKNNPKIAKEDIPVWKVICKNGDPRYFWGTGVKYEKGYHYYQTGRHHFSFDIEKYFDSWRINIDMGLHSCKNKYRAMVTHYYYSENHKIVKMYIPKGAKYYENEEEYVSNELVWYKN